jgi:hypothetical protein
MPASSVTAATTQKRLERAIGRSAARSCGRPDPAATATLGAQLLDRVKIRARTSRRRSGHGLVTDKAIQDNLRMKRDPNRLRHRRTLRFLIWLIAAIVLLPGSGFASAQDERLTFLDEDPVEFNLDQPPGASQTVEVVNGDTKALRSLRLKVIGLPGDVVTVEPPKRTGLKPGATARFTLTRKGEATSGKGRLVAVGSNGAVARRPVVLASQNVSRGDDLDDVVLRAWRV